MVWSRRQNVGNEAKGQTSDEVVVAKIYVEAVAELLQIVAELTSTPLLELGTDSYTEVVPAPQGGRLW